VEGGEGGAWGRGAREGGEGGKREGEEEDFVKNLSTNSRSFPESLYVKVQHELHFRKFALEACLPAWYQQRADAERGSGALNAVKRGAGGIAGTFKGIIGITEQ
jgi:hypothetical protein